MTKAAGVPGDSFVIPCPVLIEVGQTCAPLKKRWEMVLEFADVLELQPRIAEMAAEGLRALSSPRARCK